MTKPNILLIVSDQERQRDWSRGMALNQPNDATEGTLAAVLIREHAARHGFLTPRRGLRPRMKKKEIDNDVRSIKSKEGVKSEVGREIRPARCACRR